VNVIACTTNPFFYKQLPLCWFCLGQTVICEWFRFFVQYIMYPGIYKVDCRLTLTFLKAIFGHVIVAEPQTFKCCDNY